MFRALLAVVLVQSSLLTASTGIVAKVNGEPIYRKDLKKTSNAEQLTLEKQILYRLAIQQAKKQNLQNDPAFIAERDRLLYKTFLKKSLKGSLKPTDKELLARYEQNPYLRLRHLVLFSRNQKEKAVASKKLSEIQRKMQAGVPFKKLVLNYSQDTSVKFAGDLDFRGVNDLPPKFYKEAKKLKVGQTSKPIYSDQAVHLVHLMGIKKFKDVPETYKQFLRGRLVREKELAHLNKVLAELKKTAKIEVFEKGTKTE